MQRPTRVLAVIEAATVTGPAKNLIRFAKLTRGTADVTIATFSRTPSNAFIEAVRTAGINICIIPERRAFDLQVLPALRRSAAEIDPDIVQTHGVKSHFLIRMARLDRRFPWIAFHHGHTAEDLKMRAYNQLDRWSLRSARCVITVCGPFADELERAGVERSRIEIVPNAIEPFVPPAIEEIEAVRSRLGISADERVILTIGRLSAEKGQIDLLSAAGEILRSQSGIKFRVMIAGEGPERQRLEAAAAKLGNHVTFTGQVQDVRPLYAIADVFVLPSRSEGSPNVLLEAMAAGVPIVATSVGGVPEMVGDEFSALLTPPNQPADLAARILCLLDQPSRATLLKENAANEAARRSPGAHCEAIVSIYRQTESPCQSNSV
jgi:glycosyltransferase involved in cell wall biosynthesis